MGVRRSTLFIAEMIIIYRWFCIFMQNEPHFRHFLIFVVFTYLYKTFVKIITIASIFVFFSFTFKS